MCIEYKKRTQWDVIICTCRNGKYKGRIILRTFLYAIENIWYNNMRGIVLL